MFTENNPKYKIIEDSIYLIIRDDAVVTKLADVGVGETPPAPRKTVTSVLYASAEYEFDLNHYRVLVPIADVMVITYENGKVKSFTTNDEIPDKDTIDSRIETAVEAEVNIKIQEKLISVAKSKIKHAEYPYKLDI